MSQERPNEHVWGKRWIAGLERLATAWQSRLPRGRDYAQKGHVVSLSVTPGRISARVQGSRSKPYTTTIDVPVLREGDWAEVTKHLAREARYAAELIAGGMPDGIEQLVTARGTNLFPVRNSEMIGACNCPDKARPCKHIAAIHYAFGEALDRDPYLLLTLRGGDRRELVKGLRRIWLSVEQHEEIDTEDDPTAVRGLPVLPLLADRFNRSPDTIEQMSFTMRLAEQPLFILGRLGAPSSWQLPVPIAALLGPVYEETSRRALEIAMAEPLRDDVAVWHGDDSEFESDDWDDDDLDEDDDEGEDDDLDDDDEEGDDEKSGAASPDVAELRYRTLDFAAPAFPSMPSPAASSQDTDAAPAFFLPRSLARVTATPNAPAAAPAEPEGGSVLIRKGVAALSRSRKKQRTTGSLGAVSQSDELRDSLVTGSLPAVGARPSEPAPAPARVAAGSTFGQEPVIFETHAARGIKGGSKGARAKAGRAMPVIETVVRTRNRTVEHGTGDVPVVPPAPMPSNAPPLVRRAVAAPEARPSAPAPASYGSALMTPGPAVRGRAGEERLGGERAAFPTGPRAAARTFDDNARRAFDRVEGPAALEAAREAWRLEPSDARYLMLMAAADLAGAQAAVLEEEVSRLVAAKPNELNTSQILLLLTAGRTMYVADWADKARASIWRGDDAPGDVLVPFALIAASDGAELASFNALQAVWNRLAARGERFFPDIEEPPAPAGAWLDWSLADHPPIESERNRLLSLAATLVLDLLATERATGGDREARAAAQWVLAVIQALRAADRDAEVRPFAMMARRAAGVQARLARAVEAALLDADVE